LLAVNGLSPLITAAPEKQTQCSYQVRHVKVFCQLADSFWLPFVCCMVMQLNKNLLCNKSNWS